ncbi:MAG TPA: hypothetical protein VFS20_26870 [Longimicrobium sp.]|nr:hypothetical protein [Longimicrobium sp.]
MAASTTTTATQCTEHYPDIFTPVPATEKPGPDGQKPTERENKRRKILYLAVRHLLRKNFSFDPDNSTTVRPQDFPNGFGKKGPSVGTKTYEELLLEEKVLFASVYGVLLSRNLADPSLGRAATGTAGPNDIYVPPADADGEIVLIVERFVEALTDAVKRFNANRALFREVFRVLLLEGRKEPDDPDSDTTLHTRLLAEVTGRLIEDRIPADHPQIRRFVLTALTQALSSRVDGTASDIDIRDIDLEAGTAVDIVASNVLAVAGLYRAAMLEEMKLFAVADKVAEHFTIGMIPISRGPAGDRLFTWIREAPNRFTEVERRAIYGRVLGLAQGNAQNQLPNREFSDLWIRFLSIVSVLSRETGIQVPRSATSEQALKAARDLAVNLSLHGFGVAHFAAVETQQLLQQVLDMLQQAEILAAYGTSDYLQLTDRLSGMYLGGSVNTVRYRTMAQAGFNIMRWLADHAPQLSSSSIVSSTALFADPLLVDNVERWLAVTGTPDASVQKYTDPVDLKTQPLIPSFAPTSALGGNGTVDRAAVVRNALEQAGLGGALPAVPQL